MLNSNMKTTVGLLLSNVIFLIIGLVLTPAEDRAFFGPLVAPFIILFAVFSIFCFKEKKWSYTGSLILSIIALVVFFVVATGIGMPPEQGQGPPAAFVALLMILPVLLRSEEHTSELQSQR